MPRKTSRLWAKVQNFRRYRGQVARDVFRSISVVDGAIRPAALTVCMIVRDEMYYLPAFLAHHRRLGVQQFLLLDDGSSDETRDYLAAQSDCVVLVSDIGFGDPGVLASFPNGQMRRATGGVWLKHFISQYFVQDGFVLYLDADEFLLLPPGCASLQEFAISLRASNINSVAASLVELYPESFEVMISASNCRPDSLDEILGHCNYYDARPLIAHDRFRAGLREVSHSAATRLFKAASIRPPVPKEGSWSATSKTPLFFKSSSNWLVGSHKTYLPPDGRVLLSLLHMKFTFDLYRRVEAAMLGEGGAHRAGKYGMYGELIGKLKDGSVTSLLGEESRKYSGPEGFMACGLMHCRLDFV
jgi:hypothetical protein